MISGRKKIAGAIAGITGLFAVQGCSDQQAQAADRYVSVTTVELPKKGATLVADHTYDGGRFLKYNPDGVSIAVTVDPHLLEYDRNDETPDTLDVTQLLVEKAENACRDGIIGKMGENYEVAVRGFPQENPRLGSSIFSAVFFSKARNTAIVTNPANIETLDQFKKDCGDLYASKENVDLAYIVD